MRTPSDDQGKDTNYSTKKRLHHEPVDQIGELLVVARGRRALLALGDAALALGRVVGVGMNADELAQNARLSEWVTRDLNDEPELPFADGSFDAVLNVVSVDYLTRPLEVFREARRVLRPGGRAIMAFSNRCFASKAIAKWLSSDDAGRAAAEGAAEPRSPVGSRAANLAAAAAAAAAAARTAPRVLVCRATATDRWW
mgnify:CR=1 FL=1